MKDKEKNIELIREVLEEGIQSPSKLFASKVMDVIEKENIRKPWNVQAFWLIFGGTMILLAVLAMVDNPATFNPVPDLWSKVSKALVQFQLSSPVFYAAIAFLGFVIIQIAYSRALLKKRT